MKKILYTLVFGGCIVGTWVFGTQFAEAATLALSPASQSVSAGSTFSVTINLDTASQAAYGVDIYSLHFNPAVLQVVDSDSVTAGVQIAAGSLMSSTQYNTVNNTTGTIQFSQTPAATGANYTGTGVLATVTFQAIAAGISAVTFDFTAGNTTDTNVAGLYSDLLTAVTNGSFTVVNATDTTAPTTPSGLAASTVSSTGISVSWTASTDPTVAGQTTSGVAGYKVFRCSGASCTATVQIATTTAASFTDSGLSAAATYGYRIQAYDNSGNSSTFSSSAYATTSTGADTTAPTVPATLTAQVVSSSQINVTWTASTDPTVAGQTTSGVAGYKVFKGGVQIATTTTTSFPNMGLSPATLYSFAVAAYDNANNSSAQTSPVSATTQSLPDTAAPSVSITSPAGGTISGTVSFGASASDPVVAGATTSGLFQISLYVDNALYATSTVGAGSVTASLDTTILSNASHTLLASAKDNAGNSATSSPVAITVFNVSNATRYPRTLVLSALEGLASIPAGQPITASVISPITLSVLSTQPLTPDANGKYTVTFQSTYPQTVSIRVAATGYLARLLANIDTTINSAASLTVPQLSAGDFNNDGIINTLDYSLLNSHWNQSFATADINADGLINTLDFAILKNNWNAVGE